MVLDTDIGSDVDDALALALAIRHPGIDLRAVTTVSGDTTKRAHIAARLLAVAGLTGIEVAAGVRVDADAPNWFGHETEGLPSGDEVPLSNRDGVDLLCTVDPRTVVATIGMQSNAAAAVRRDPSLVDRIELLAVMGGSFGPIITLDGTELPPGDWNFVCDPDGAVASLNAGFPILYVPIDVTVRCPLRRAHLDRLRTGDELCRTLARLVDVWYEQRLVPQASASKSDAVAFLHDPLTVACTVDRSFVTIERLSVRVELVDGVPRTLIGERDGREADVVRSVDAPAFADWWLETVFAR
jgi:purine nucleosidase